MWDYCEGKGLAEGIMRRVREEDGKTLVTCPACGKEMLERIGPFGQPYGLTQHRRKGDQVLERGRKKI